MSRNPDFNANAPEKSRGKAPSYIDYLNQFHRWRENHSPGDKVIVLYVNMLDMFSRRYWPEWAGVTTAQLMALTNTTNKKTALSARDALVKAGFLEYRPGWKGTATVYKLLNFGIESDTEHVTENDTESRKNGCEFVPKNDTENGCESVPPNYVRLNKDKEYPPPNPPKGGMGGKTRKTRSPERKAMQEARTLSPEEESGLLAVSPRLCDTVRNWMAYKAQRGQGYVPISKRVLLEMVYQSAEQFGADAVSDVIQNSMSRGWQGIIWENL